MQTAAQALGHWTMGQGRNWAADLALLEAGAPPVPVALDPPGLPDHCILSNTDPVPAQVMVGGTNQAADLSRFKARAPDVLVATPGRLNDNLQDGAVSTALAGIRTLVFDEADRLLDMGFR